MPQPNLDNPEDIRDWFAGLPPKERFNRRSRCGCPLSAYLKAGGAPNPQVFMDGYYLDADDLKTWVANPPHGPAWCFVRDIDSAFGVVTAAQCVLQARIMCGEHPRVVNPKKYGKPSPGQGLPA